MHYYLNKENSKKCVNVSDSSCDLELSSSHLYAHSIFLSIISVNSLGDINPISLLIDQANVILQEKSDGLSAEETLGLLKSNMKQLKSYSIPDGLVSEEDSVASDMSDIGQLTFGYEEEADP